MHHDDFTNAFRLLTGHPPFPWQEALFHRFLAGDFPRACNIPTGLGKTATIAVWLLAVAARAETGSVASFPRRLVYVVNRRTVVDQATTEVERLRDALRTEAGLADVATALRDLCAFDCLSPVGVSTLRGQFADNAEWRNDPARPAVIVGTVDMIGSRLLFTGYGCGFKSKPLHAGFLGQGTLLVHDEAHLEPAFQSLITGIGEEQRRCGDRQPMRVMALTATSREGCADFELSDADRAHPVICERVTALKGIQLTGVLAAKEIAPTILKRALEHRDIGAAVIVFVRRLEDAEAIGKALHAARLPYQFLTGTLRGFERDRMMREDPVFARFMPESVVAPGADTVYLICTSAGEVGINISADHMVCDVTPFDSMAQRLGRVNRFGRGDAQVDVVHLEDPLTISKTPSAFDEACGRTLLLLTRLPKRVDGRYDASPDGLASLPPDARADAFTPAPVVLAATDILFDAWSLTTLRQPFPGRPPVEDWLHGLADWDPPQTSVAWREEVDVLSGDLLDQYDPSALLEDYPLKPQELLRDGSGRVLAQLAAIASRAPDTPAWIIGSRGTVDVVRIGDIAGKTATKANADLRWATVLLPPSAGGLRAGLLDGTAEHDAAMEYDVSGYWLTPAGTPRRCRVWDTDERPARMRLIRVIDVGHDADESEGSNKDSPRRRWGWFVRPRSADDDGSWAAAVEQDLDPHLSYAEHLAMRLAERLGLDAAVSLALRWAARWHDRGKARSVWQRGIGNREYPRRTLAKSGGKAPGGVERSSYRHEFGSLLDLTSDDEFKRLSPDVCDLTLHMVASHHGRARPHFPPDENFDPERTDAVADVLAPEVPRRFARLQRRYGRWGLAYLESLLRVVDAEASRYAAPAIGQAGAPADGAEVDA